jgi:hypothetical protein
MAPLGKRAGERPPRGSALDPAVDHGDTRAVASQLEKSIFNRRLGLVVSGVTVFAWLGTLAVRFLEPEKDATAGHFITPVFVLWGAFLFVPSHQTGPDEDRYAWSRRALAVFGIMEAISVVFVLLT